MTQLAYGLRRIWSISVTPDSNFAAFACDEGTVVIKLGKDLPLAAYSNGKVVWIRQRELQTFNLKLLQGAKGEEEDTKDGEQVSPQNVKDLGASEVTGA